LSLINSFYLSVIHLIFSAGPKLSSALMWCRSTYTSDAAAGHAADAWQRSTALLFRLLHLRHHRSPAVGRAAAQSLLPQSPAKRLRCRVGLKLMDCPSPKP